MHWGGGPVLAGATSEVDKVFHVRLVGLIGCTIDFAGKIGLNFDFLNSHYQTHMWLDGMFTTLILMAVMLPRNLVFGFLFAATLTLDQHG